MSGSRGNGFTVIELMLFLAISGFLVIGIMAGATVAVNFQRYKDATNSFVNFVQGQYDRVANVQNNHEPNLQCTAASGIAVTPTPPVTVGASTECYIVGRLLSISDNGTKIRSEPVYATQGDGTGDDIAVLSSAGLFLSSMSVDVDTYSPEWSTAIVPPKPTALTSMDGWNLLIARSPSTGSIRTFTTMHFTSVQAMITDPLARADVTACVDPKGLTTVPSSGVTIVKDAASISGVKMTKQGQC